MSQTIKMLKYDFPNHDYIDIFAIADMHIGHEGFNEPEFQRLIRFILSDEHNYIVLAGDLTDNQIKSSVGSPFESTMRPSEQRKYAAELLQPLKDRILCAVPGNHEEKSVKETDTNPLEMIMDRLDMADKYKRDQAYLNISVGRRRNHEQTPPNYAICVMHGKSGGKTAGAGLTASDWTAATSGADLFITAHTHKPSTFAGARFICNAGKSIMMQRSYQLLICTSWLDYVGYGVRGMYRPTPIVINRATLYGTEYSIETHQRTR